MTQRHFPTAAAPHLPPARDVASLMRDVLLALTPGIAAHVWFFGPGILLQIALAALFALAAEALVARWRRQRVKRLLGDYSALVTAVLFALSVPPLAPWWIALTGMASAIWLVKHAYGGLGYNRFNPAMAGFAIVLISFPLTMSQWLAPAPLNAGGAELSEIIKAIGLGQLPAAAHWDAISSATPLGLLRSGRAQNLLVSEVRLDPVFGDFGGHGWEWIANWYLAGGLWLLYRRVINWRVPVATLGTTLLLTLPFYLIDPAAHPLPLQHVFSGALVLGAFFIATDPVSGASTPAGRLWFGVGVAVLTLAIRRWGNYPDGVAFAVLTMNAFAPLIDRYCRPRIYGERR